MKRIDRLDGRGYITNNTRTDASELLYATTRDVTRLKSEVAASKGELENLTAARVSLEASIDQLKKAYNDGVIRSPADGVVGASVPAEGEVFSDHEAVAEAKS